MLKKLTEEQEKNNAPNKRLMFMKSKIILLFIAFVFGFFLGNRIFNHLNAWIGIVIILSTIIYFIYVLLKLFKSNETKD